MDNESKLAEENYPFSGHRIVRPITKEEIDAFNMERFKFSEHALPPGKAVSRPSSYGAVREAAVALLEAAMGERYDRLPKYTEDALRRYANDIDQTIW